MLYVGKKVRRPDGAHQSRFPIQVTIPKADHTLARLAVGELIKATFEEGMIVLLRRLSADRTPDIEGWLAEAGADPVAGRVTATSTPPRQYAKPRGSTAPERH